MIRALDLALRLLPFGLTLVAAIWIGLQSPFTAPMVQLSAAQIEATLTRAMAGRVTLGWLLPRVQAALLDEDLVQLDLLLGLANDHGVILPRSLVEDIAALDAARSGLLARTTACGACAVDITACETLAQLGVCAIPFEMTPAGDVNALRRAGVAYAGGQDVDRLDLGLGLIGLGATGAVLVSGGSSYTVKAGASLLRMARRLGTLTPALAARLTTLVGDAVRWDRLGDLGRVPPSALIDSTKLEELGQIGGALRQVAQQTSVAETVGLLRHVDSAGDAARLARVSTAMGPKTRGAFEVLGKTRVMRATARLSNLAIGAIAAFYVLALQLLVFAGQQTCNLALRGARRHLGRRQRAQNRGAQI